MKRGKRGQDAVNDKKKDHACIEFIKRCEISGKRDAFILKDLKDKDKKGCFALKMAANISIEEYRNGDDLI